VTMRAIPSSIMVACAVALGAPLASCNGTIPSLSGGDDAAPNPPPARHSVAKAGPEYPTPWGWSTVPFVPPVATTSAPSLPFSPLVVQSKSAKAASKTAKGELSPQFSPSAPPVTPASWLEPEWDYDPVAGNDANNCLSVSTPCKTFAQIVSRWGTLEPTFPQNTFVRQLSAQSTTGDPVRIRVHTSGTATFWYVGVPQVLTTGTLGTVTAKTYGSAGSGHPLEAVLPAGQVAGYLITDTTQGNSTGFLDRVTTGTTWIIEQPLTAPVLPNTTFGSGRSENNSWATGDAYTISQLPAVYMLEWSPTFGDFNASFSNYPQLQDVQIMDPGADVGFSIMLVENFSLWQDVSVLRSVGMVPGNPEGFYCVGCDIYGQLQSTQGWGATSGLITLEGGAIRGNGANPVQALDIGYDIILGSGGVNGGTLIQQGGRWGISGTAGSDGVYIDTNGTWAPEGFDVLRVAGAGTLQAYGPGTLNVGGSVSMAITNATSTMLMATWQMNGSNTACSQSNVTPSVINCGITLTPAHFDATFGTAGFGGVAKSFYSSAVIQNAVNN